MPDSTHTKGWLENEQELREHEEDLAVLDAAVALHEAKINIINRKRRAVSYKIEACKEHAKAIEARIEQRK